ncbi:MAG TPA: hypothetical protein VIW78_11240 [Burkholderiales bacterium]
MNGLWTLLLFFAVALSTWNAQAACTCQCVNGAPRAVCNWANEPEPVCPPRFCPMPRVVPEAPPPPGPRNCKVTEVLNDRTGKYEKREICS